MPPTVLTPATPIPTDPRVVAYCSPGGPEVFSGIVHGSQIWTPDPFDVDAVHADARTAFFHLLDRASDGELPPHGKSLLLLGEAGSGKTHLMRAFRNATHEDGSGYCGYLQMLSRSDNYPRYVLSYLIDSLEQPYKPNDPTTGLARLAHGLLDAIGVAGDPDCEQLCEDILESDEVARIVFRFAEIAVQDKRFTKIDINLLRAVLFLLPNDGRIRPKVLNWLRCEDLPKFDREALGGLVPRPGPEMPLRTIVDLGRLMHAVHSAALVLLVDQMDEMIELARGDAQPGEQFRAAVNALIDITESLPNAVVVIGCLEDLFEHAKQKGFLPRAKLDRLEHDPEPVRLTSQRTAEEVLAIAARRLAEFFEAVDVERDPHNPLSPYTGDDLAPLTGFRARDILDFFRKHRDACVQNKRFVALRAISPSSASVPSTDFAGLWNDFLPTVKPPIVDEPKLAELLAWSIAALSEEMSNGVTFGTDPDNRFVQVEVQGGNDVDKLLVAICDKGAQGGGLKNQIDETVKRSGEIPAVFVRSTEFSKNPKTDIATQIAKLCVPVGRHRKAVVASRDWRVMTAFRAFEKQYRATAGFAGWRQSERPLGGLPALRQILGLDKYELVNRATLPREPELRNQAVAEGSSREPMSTDRIQSLRESVSASQNSPPRSPDALASGTSTVKAPEPLPTGSPLLPSNPPKPSDSTIAFATTRSAVSAPVELPPKSLCRHAAFLGGSGSGKTTVALAIIEQLLLSGVPAVLLDRKGDLARYADPNAWTATESDPLRATSRNRLRAALDIALYTPGSDHGRPLAIPVVPPDLAQVSTAEREQIAQFASAGLGVMMGYKAKGTDPKLVILQKAIEALAISSHAVTVKALQKLVADQDDLLLAQFDGQYEDKHFKALATDLLTLSLRHRRLLEGSEVLDVDRLLGRGTFGVPGQTRLTILNTQFLGDAGTTDFWVSQLLLAVDRWRAKNPASEGLLQAVFLFDEADAYLPAVGKPATKGPMEGLLKRARSAGIGLFLATQSPGDFDYRCRDQVLTWLIGRVKEPVAIGKLKPMLEARPGAADKLADQKTGEFYLVRESDVQPILANRNILPMEQLPEDRILELARKQAPV